MLKPIVLLTCLASPALAQSVEECDWRARVNALAEPWETYSRTYSNGAVRIALIALDEPAAGGYHLLVLSPPYDETGYRQCRIVTNDSSIGFPGLEWDDLEAEYDPATGLTFRVPVAIYDASIGSVFQGDILRFTLNQSTGDISTGME